jgi:hypothetical protein
MREILFKAKRVDNGEWVEGDLSTGKSIHIINDNDCYIVHPSTVCQFTGLLDNNGKKVWEGDLVDLYHDNGVPKETRWQPGGFYFEDPDDGAIWLLTEQCDHDLEITGNIHDKEGE